LTYNGTQPVLNQALALFNCRFNLLFVGALGHDIDRNIIKKRTAVLLVEGAVVGNDRDFVLLFLVDLGRRRRCGIAVAGAFSGMFFGLGVGGMGFAFTFG
jgi:hypothetical protein